MSWLQKLLPPKINRTGTGAKKVVPEGLWSKCPSCNAVLYATDLESNASVCPKCGYHNRLSARARLNMLLDAEGRFEIGAEVEPVDTLRFKDSRKYSERLDEAQTSTGESDALVVMQGAVKTVPLVVAAFEFDFMGGSMGSVVGERFVRGVHVCLDQNLPLVCVTASGGAPKQITSGNHQFLPSSMSKNGVVAGVLSDANEPGDVAVFNLKQPVPRKITDVNGDLLEGRKLGETEEIWYDSVGGMKVQGWIVKPPDFDPAKKYPLILYIHGGPHTMYGVGFNFEFQNHAAEGYVVLYTNPRGSTGYGKEFGNAINNNYPGQDYDDLMNGVDALLKRGYIDEKNLFVTGGSGGGVLTAWIVGHTDRFAAAVSMKPVINWYSFVGTTDGADWYYNFKKLPWEDPSEHLRRSPITYVGNVKTPTMVLAGDLDLRVPLEQPEQYFRALKLLKVPTAMVRLNDEYHGFNAAGLRHPSNRLSQIAYLRMWFDKFKRK